ncbi:MAG: TIGR00289 family protein [Candidatus Aenigmarchaeota archaeon ex4484_52]|nr:MAG: TIGR00289 family protein [Candidatus Aenigmarchaeota archaeon ex4484_52]
MKIGALISGGKDSLFALYLMKQKHNIPCIITIKPLSDESYMFHHPNINLVKAQSKLMKIPYIEKTTKGKKEEELNDLELLIRQAKEKFNIDGICSGAIQSNYQKTRIETLAKKLQLKSFAPLWNKDPLKLLNQMLDNNFEIIITSVAAQGLDADFLGKNLRDILPDLIKLNKKYKIHLAGEGGEFETFVIACPLFKGKKILIKNYKIITEKKQNSARLIIKKWL